MLCVQVANLMSGFGVIAWIRLTGMETNPLHGDATIEVLGRSE
jgi:hypothetical protein